ncbi:LacI family DNA-binding transcriptional regulator [Vibrio fluvialis]|uniref:LacI family DNA-binding transcriptional regulator n=1 Tax=Vibrio fluvialis TaxID=676 RepID=UPI00130265B0|nr:LacI family DNA-binding transcriptional regulator [Vibrio fluvialis]MCE7605315.1 LacI family transcriptional regulator [Vibrio fluvialis]
MATINDVCKAAGVSKATVSRVLNGSGQVKEATRQVVMKAMSDLGYQPNALAQALATNTSHSIGLILPQFQSSYFGSVLHHAEQGAQQAGKKLLVVNSKDTADGEREAVATLTNQRCDAIMLYSRHLSQDDLDQLQHSIAVPLVVINRQLSIDSVPSFGLDQCQLATIAMQHLLDLGHQRIACITSPLQSETGRLRFGIYQDMLNRHHIECQNEWVAEGNNTLERGYQAAQELLAHGCSFSAIFACNDDMAIGAIRALHDAGLSVPHDVSVIGIDNEPAAAYAIPSLSTVSLPITKLTQDSVALTITLANKQQLAPQHQTYCGELVRRESTRAVK